MKPSRRHSDPDGSAGVPAGVSLTNDPASSGEAGPTGLDGKTDITFGKRSNKLPSAHSFYRIIKKLMLCTQVPDPAHGLLELFTAPLIEESLF